MENTLIETMTEEIHYPWFYKQELTSEYLNFMASKEKEELREVIRLYSDMSNLVYGEDVFLYIAVGTKCEYSDPDDMADCIQRMLPIELFYNYERAFKKKTVVLTIDNDIGNETEVFKNFTKTSFGYTKDCINVHTYKCFLPSFHGKDEYFVKEFYNAFQKMLTHNKGSNVFVNLATYRSSTMNEESRLPSHIKNRKLKLTMFLARNRHKKELYQYFIDLNTGNLFLDFFPEVYELKNLIILSWPYQSGYYIYLNPLLVDVDNKTNQINIKQIGIYDNASLIMDIEESNSGNNY